MECKNHCGECKHFKFIYPFCQTVGECLKHGNKVVGYFYVACEDFEAKNVDAE